MPAYSFKERFIPLIKSGEKKQTIRSKRKCQAKPGDTLYLYFGMRTKWCTKILETTCIAVSPIEIKKNGSVYIGGAKLNDLDKDMLAYHDGFRPDSLQDIRVNKKGCFNVMFRWWRQTHALPFKGDIIYW